MNGGGKIHISYSYDDLIQELKEELEDGILTQDSEIYVLRGDPITEDYSPIVDWDYIEDVNEEPTEKEIKIREKFVSEGEILKVYETLAEMLDWNRVQRHI